MNIFISAYSKNLDPHRVFKGKIEKQNIRNWPSPSTFNGKAICSPITLDNELIQNLESIFHDDEGKFEPGVQINVAADMILNGRYRFYQSFSKDELILMLASILKKSDIDEVVNKIESLVEE